jgi:uncharacterized protein (DUF427 family)
VFGAAGYSLVVKAVWRGQVLAESGDTIELGGYRYFPRDAVRMELLHQTARTESDLRCPHGVQFFDVGEGEAVSPRAAWTYETPQPSHRSVDHWIGFWHEVEVLADDRY